MVPLTDGSGPSEARAPHGWAFALAISTFAFAVRCLSLPRVFDGAAGHAVLPGNDPWYHLHRVRAALEGGGVPSVASFDPLLNWPDGARPIWTPFFDGGVALLVAPVHAALGIDGALGLAAFVPPLLGALAVAVIYLAARDAFDETTARVASASLAVLAGHTWYSQLGFLDHHVAVSLLAALALWSAMVFAREPSARASAALSTTHAALLLCWPGALLHVLLIEAGVVVSLLLSEDAAERTRALWLRTAGHAASALVLLPFCYGQEWEVWSAWSASVLSPFQPLLFAAGALHASASAWWCGRRDGAHPLAASLAFAGLIALASLAAFAPLRTSLAEAWEWFGRTEAFQAAVAESEPLLFQRGEFTFVVAARRLSLFVFALPVVAWLFARRAFARPGGSPAARVAIVWAVGIVLAAFAQKRFTHSASIAVALLLGWTARLALVHLRANTSPAAARAVVGAAVVLALLPPLAERAEVLGNSWSGEFPRRHHSKLRLLEAADWLAERPRGDSPGILAPWHLGHVLLFASRRPTVVGNFGDDVGPGNFALHREYLLSDEARGVALLDQLRSRWVVVESLPAEKRDALPANSMQRRLTEPLLEGLRHHRLVYAAPSRRTEAIIEATRRGAHAYRVFERVPGSRVTGNAPPNVVISAEMEIAIDGTVVARARVQTRSDANGDYELHIAQAGSDGVRGAWRLRAGREQSHLYVQERHILEGLPIRAQRFR